MDQSINEIHAFFSKAKRKAKTKIKPFVNEMETISIKRAKNVITDAQANIKMRAACMKNGINPQVIDGAYFEAQNIKGPNIGASPIDFNPKKKGRQAMPNLNIKSVGIDFNGKKPNRQRSPKINMVKMEFKPVNLFAPQKQQKKNIGFKPVNLFGKQKAQKNNIGFKPVNLFAPQKQQKSQPFNFPNFNIKMPKQKHKKHQGRFESVDLMPGPKGSNELFIKPIFPGNKGKPLFNGPKVKGKKKPRIGANKIKMPNFGRLF